MIPRFPLHNHSTYCDGKNTPEEMVLRAIELGCEGIGFSGHSFVKDFNDPSQLVVRTEEYISEINRLKYKYRGKIQILLGVERDALSECDSYDYDYVIGAIHLIKTDDRVLLIDGKKEDFIDSVNNFFGGDYYKFCAEYYNKLSGVIDKTRCDIVAHFDLVTKFNEEYILFDEGDKRYRDAATECLDLLLEKEPIFEINTGAISRGHRTAPYPAPFIMERIASRGGRLTVTTDCHNADHLLGSYANAVEYARSFGVRELWFPKDGNFMPYSID